MRYLLMVMVLLTVSVSDAEAQLGTVNPTAPPPPPSVLPSPLQPVPFGRDPHFLNNPHPALPWGDANRGPLDYGVFVRQWMVPDRTVTLDVMVPQPGSLPPTWERVTVVIPGYAVTEMTRGYVHPPRWTIVPVGFGGYQWQRVPGTFEPRR